MKKHGKIWKNIEKHGVLPVPVRRNRDILRSLITPLLGNTSKSLLLTRLVQFKTHVHSTAAVSTNLSHILHHTSNVQLLLPCSKYIEEDSVEASELSLQLL